MNYFQFYEYKKYEFKNIGDLGIIDILKNLPKVENLENYVTISKEYLKFKHYAGLLFTKDTIIEILPKIWGDEKKDIEKSRNNFILFFSYAFLKPEYFEKEAKWITEKKKYWNLLEFLIYFYSETLKREIEKGLYKKYFRIEDENKYLKGKINLKKQINKIDKSKFDISFFNYDANNTLNNFFGYCTELFLMRTKENENKRNLFLISYILQNEINRPYKYQFKDEIFNRLNERFEFSYDIAKLILNKKEPSIGIKTSSPKTMMYLFDMNKIFEKFIFNFLNRNKEKIFPDFKKETLNLKYQEENGFLYYIDKDFNKKGPLRLLRPDIIFEGKPIKISGEKKDKIKIIMDTKYKILKTLEIDKNDGDKEEEDIFKISSQDLYQIYTYAKSFNSKDNKENINSENNILIFPIINSKSRVEVKGPYLFNKEGKEKLWIMGIDLSFSSEWNEWKEKLIESLNENFSNIIFNKNIK
ncbi:MAG: McrC family protein [Thermoplasmata archaeon]